MSHDHGAEHGHTHGHGEALALPPAMDLSVSAEDLPASQLGRRRFL